MFRGVKRALGKQPVTMQICLRDEDGWLSPCNSRFGVAAYAVAKEVDSALHAELTKGKTVSVVVPNGIADHKGQCGICCKYGVADAKMLAATSRDEGNDENTYYLLGMKAEKGFANVVGKDNPGVDRAYRRLVYDVFGINPDANDFYDQLMRKHLEITGTKYDRVIDDEDGLYDNVKAGGNSQQRNSRQSNPKQQSNAQQPTGSQSESIKCFIDQFRVDDQGSVYVDGAFVFYPQALSTVVADVYDYCEGKFGDGKGAAMEITKLIGRACLNAIRRCLGVAEDKRHSDRDCLRFLFQMLDLKNVDQALALLYPKNGKQQNGQNQNGSKKGNKSEGTEPQTGGDSQSKAGQKPAEPASQQPQPKPQPAPAGKPADNPAGFGDDPQKDMTEGKPVRFTTVQLVISLAEQASKDAKTPLADRSKLALAALDLKQAIAERLQEDSTADSIGAVYLNKLLREIEAYDLPLGDNLLKFRET